MSVLAIPARRSCAHHLERRGMVPGRWRGAHPHSSSRGRGAGGRVALERLRARDLMVLGWCCEQYGARVDQLEVLLGTGPRSVQRVVSRLREAGLVQTRRILVGESAWVIPTSRGLRTSGLGFGLWHPRVGMLAHTAAVNDVRLHVMARSPESEWVSERVLARERESGEHLADALVITAEGQRVAIEVELTVKSSRRVRMILEELSVRYDAVLYFCAPAAHRQLSALAGTGAWPKLGVRVLPGPRVSPGS